MRGGTVRRRARTVVGAGVIAAVAVACGAGGTGTEAPEAAPAPPPGANGYITVLAADTIAPALHQEARAFQRANRLATVTVESAPSGALANELRAGRSADLYVAGGTGDMDRVVGAQLTYGQPQQFARGPDTSATPLVFSIVQLNTTGDQTTSRAFMQFLTTPKARAVLENAGFRPLT